jgi:hypothetical protein
LSIDFFGYLSQQAKHWFLEDIEPHCSEKENV